MAPITKMLLMLFLIIIGISMSSNNYIHQYIVTVFYHHKSLVAKLLRPFGLVIALSSVLFLTEYENVGILINLMIGMLLIFCFIRTRSQLRKRESNTREQAIKQYQAEIDAKRKQIEEIKADIAQKNNKEKKSSDWNNKAPTTKEILNGLSDNETSGKE